MTQNDLAIAYSERIKGERGENIEKAIAFYEAALQVYTRDAFPQQWTQTQHNLASAYELAQNVGCDRSSKSDCSLSRRIDAKRLIRGS